MAELLAAQDSAAAVLSPQQQDRVFRCVDTYAICMFYVMKTYVED